MPTRFGSPLYHDNYPCSDASTVSILRDAGSLIFGSFLSAEWSGSDPQFIVCKENNDVGIHHGELGTQYHESS